MCHIITVAVPSDIVTTCDVTTNANDTTITGEEFNRRLSKIPAELQTTEVRDNIFHELMGSDGHGYFRTYGSSVPRSAVNGQGFNPSQASSSSSIAEITRPVREVVTQELEQRITEKFMVEFQGMKARLDSYESPQVGTNSSERSLISVLRCVDLSALTPPHNLYHALREGEC
ncbi:hypothetical protein Acr_20g0008280 [Actinidia rufa]|uniref:Uncharacterized protein n=1 Tax=Actinidia rufa TaxID=165716 RepID=A0A7J0GDX2_9ERIC|nr:hypothetical protein Acr_20g0008280 [Actinidia rufa]